MACSRRLRVSLFSDPVSPWALLDGAIGVYTVSSQLGFEAIFAGHEGRRVRDAGEDLGSAAEVALDGLGITLALAHLYRGIA